MKLARVFCDGMVLQRDRPVCIFGHAEKEETVDVRWNGEKICTQRIPEGDFSFLLPARSAEEDAVLEIGETVLRHVDVGEVWVAGGQSNMEFMLRFDRDAQETITQAKDPHLRTYIVGQYAFPGERELGYKDWNPWDRWLTFCPEHAPDLPAAAVYFAQELRQQGVPVGILSCNWGGTTASTWMERERLEKDPELRVYIEDFNRIIASLDLERFEKIQAAKRPAMASQASQEEWGVIMKNTFHPQELMKRMQEGNGASSLPDVPGIEPGTVTMEEWMQAGPGDKNEPGALYETMVREIIGWSVRGVIWYQGESDARHPPLYAHLFGSMVRCWREAWLEKNPSQTCMPFLFVQLAPFGTWLGDSGFEYPELRRQQQIAADTVPDAYMAVITDIGNIYDIHPKVKKPIGHRLALLARKYVYGEKTLSADAPRARRLVRDGDALRISFQDGEGLLLQREDFSSYNGFPVDTVDAKLLPPILDGVNGLLVTADGEVLSDARCFIEEDMLVIRHPALKEAERITAAFARTAFCQVNLFSREGLPVRPFEFVLTASGREAEPVV